MNYLGRKKNKPEHYLNIENLENDLLSSKFRLLNEKLYTISSQEALNYFDNNEEDYQIYHKGFASQVEKWPKNPNDLILKSLKQKNKFKNLIIADIGCGEAKIAQNLVPLGYNIYSFDLVKLNEYITKADMKNLPLDKASIDLGIFCLSLMNTNFPEFILEANRILKKGARLIVAEITSRVTNFKSFIKIFKVLGFKLIKKVDVEGYFFILTFLKVSKAKLNDIKNITEDYHNILKPCFYKRR